MIKKISKIWFVLPGRATISVIIIPRVLNCSLVLGIGYWLFKGTGHYSFSQIVATFTLFILASLLAWGVSLAVRVSMFLSLLDWLKRHGELGRILSSAGNDFYLNARNNGHFFIMNSALKAMRQVGLEETDNLLAEIGKNVEPSPLIWWKAAVWGEKFGNATNHVLPYAILPLSPCYRPLGGWWADRILPGHEGSMRHKALRDEVIIALPHADLDEGRMLMEFLFESAAMNNENLTDLELNGIM